MSGYRDLLLRTVDEADGRIDGDDGGYLRENFVEKTSGLGDWVGVVV